MILLFLLYLIKIVFIILKECKTMKTKESIPLPWKTRERLKAFSQVFPDIPALETPTTGEKISHVIACLQPIAKCESAAFSLLRELDSYRCYGE